MSTVHSIAASDIVANSRSVLTTNFANLNTDKIEATTVAQMLASTISTVGVTPSVLGETRKYVYKSGNQTTSSSVLVNDDALFFNVGANEAWRMTTRLLWSSNNVPDIKYTFTAPTGTAGYFSDDDASQIAITPSSTTNLSAGGTATNIVGINGVFTTSVAGSIQLQWAQNTNAASSVLTVYAGSNIIAERIN